MGVKKFLIISMVFAVSFMVASCAPGSNTGSDQVQPSSDELKKGEALFNKLCAECHGIKAAGTSRGPTFLDPIYKPNHHADQAFTLAATSGVRAHHWSFGDMPPVRGVTEDDVTFIRKYVRALQKDAGIY